jgi:hypothetical protein
VGSNSGSIVDVPTHLCIYTYFWAKNHFTEVLCGKAHFYGVNTRDGAKDLPCLKKCTALNILFLSDCLLIGFETGFVQLRLFFLVIVPPVIHPIFHSSVTNTI